MIDRSLPSLCWVETSVRRTTCTFGICQFPIAVFIFSSSLSLVSLESQHDRNRRAALKCAYDSGVGSHVTRPVGADSRTTLRTMEDMRTSPIAETSEAIALHSVGQSQVTSQTNYT